MPQQKIMFAEWYSKVTGHAAGCVWDWVARDVILIQTSNTKLQKKIIAEENHTERDCGWDYRRSVLSVQKRETFQCEYLPKDEE